jgi:hypothetical protein
MTRLKREWTYLMRSPPGKRFQMRYRRVRERRARLCKGREDEATRIFWYSVALVLFGLGFFLFVFPLVYIPFLAAGAAILASESLTCARLFDHAESAIRSGWASFRDKTGMTPRSAMVIGGLVALACLGLTGRYWYNALMH